MLRALAHYKYLTISHIIQLGLSVSKDRCRKYFAALRKRGFTGRQTHYSVSPRFAGDTAFIRKHYENIHYLTRKGVKFLTTHTGLENEHIHFPKNPSNYLANDYLHRISTISIHISFDIRTAQQEATQPLFWTYYKHHRQSTNKRFEAQTHLRLSEKKGFTPDVLCSYYGAEQAPFMYCLEVYNGDKTKYASKQLSKLFQIIDESQVIEQKLGLSAVPRILCVCDNEKLLANIQERLKGDKRFWVQHIEQLIFFKLDREVREDF